MLCKKIIFYCRKEVDTFRDGKCHLLLFVHGYNNDMHDVLEAAHQLQQRYGVEVLAFSWPALGGRIEGTLNYKADKREARASVGALERAIKIMHERLELITRGNRDRFRQKAQEKHPDNIEAREAYYAQLVDRQCPFTINAMYHSMDNYLLKHMLKSTANEGNPLLFDNVVLCQADTNHRNHLDWVDTICFRKRLFITINEDDRALSASRLKLGSDQLARLGHYAKDLASRHAHYINLTNAAYVKDSHSPFTEAADKNEKVATFFRQAFSGDAAERKLRYSPEGNWYGPR